MHPSAMFEHAVCSAQVSWSPCDPLLLVQDPPFSGCGCRSSGRATRCETGWRACKQVRQLEMERFSMSKALEGGDKAAAARIKALDKQLNELKKEQEVRSGAGVILRYMPAVDVAHYAAERFWADAVPLCE